MNDQYKIELNDTTIHCDIDEIYFKFGFRT